MVFKELFKEEHGTYLTNRICIGVFVLLAIHLLIPVFQWGDSHIAIHDNLDSSFVYYEILAQNNALLTLRNVMVSGIFGEIESWTFGRLWGYRLIRAVFEPLAAYNILIIIQTLTAFIGMFWFASRFLVQYNKWRYEISAFVSLAFAVLPFWPFGGLTVAGLPLVAATIASGLHDKSIKWVYAVLLLFVASFSIFVLSWIFYIPLVLLVLAYFTVCEGWSAVRQAWAYLGLFIIALLLTRWIEFAPVFFNEAESIRSEFVRQREGMVEALKIGVRHFIKGQYHAYSFHEIIFLLGALAVGVLLYKRQLPSLLFAFLAVLCVTSSFLFGVYKWSGANLLEEYIPLLRQINWGRFFWLSPFFWWSLAALCVGILAPQTHKHAKVFVVALCVLILAQYALSTKRSDFLIEEVRGNPSYTEFFAPSLFTQIKNDLDIPADKYVVAVGMHPSVLQYNGFHTLDGYISVAPLAKKQLFQEIMAPEVEKNPVLKDYIDNWGARLYILSNDLYTQSGTSIAQAYKNKNYEIYNLDIRYDLLRDNNVSHLISAVPIRDYKEKNIAYAGNYTDDKSVWEIYVYCIDERCSGDL
jgi:hypothetical protein